MIVSMRSRRTRRPRRWIGTPTDRLAGAHERRVQKNEDAQHVVPMKKFSGAAKSVEGHSFVEPREDVRMGGLEADSHLEPSLDQALEPAAPVGIGTGEKSRVRLDDHPLEAADRARDLLVVRWRNRLRVEEASGVVHLICRAASSAATAAES